MRGSRRKIGKFKLAGEDLGQEVGKRGCLGCTMEFLEVLGESWES